MGRSLAVVLFGVGAMKRPTKKTHRLNEKMGAAASWIEDSELLDLTRRFAVD